MATIKVFLPDPMKAWNETQAEDHVRDLIRKDQERREAMASLQAAITEGIESGEPQLFDAAAFKLRMRERNVVG